MQIPIAVQSYVINGALISLAVLIHYEMLRLLSTIIPRWNLPHRWKVMVALFGTLTAHVMEIWMFAMAYFALIENGNFGSLEGLYTHSLMDCVYFSFISYTTMGFGDIHPVGLLRFLSGLEGLTGIVLITWSASFMFIEMEKFWDDR